MATHRPWILAHRGFSANAPENTFAAFEAARLAGADGVELDVQCTKDGQLVVIHDEKVDRTTNGRGWVKDYTYGELQTLDAGGWFDNTYRGEKIPLLGDVLRWAKHYRLLVNIELKTGVIQYPEIERKTIQLVHERDMLDQVLISSFNHQSLRTVKAIDSRFPIGLLYTSGLVEPWLYAKRMLASAIHPFYPNIVPELINGCHANQIMVNPFTVDEITDLQRMVALRTDAVITNHPDRLYMLLQQEMNNNHYKFR